MKLIIWALHGLFWWPYLLRGQVDRRAGRQPGATVVAAPYAKTLVGLHSVAFFFLYFGIGWQQALPAWPIPVIGAALCLAGYAISVWTLRIFRSWRLRAELDDKHELSTDGPFRYVRHPIYLSLNLLGLGTLLWAPNGFVVFGLVLSAIVGDLRARSEEKLLIGAFGEKYQTYMAQTKRFVPGVY